MVSPPNPNQSGSSAKQSLEAGLAALKQQDYPTAIALLESVTQTAANGSSSGIRAQMGLVAAYKATGDVKKAIALCSSLAPQNHRKINQNPQKLPPKQALSPLMPEQNRRKNRLGAMAYAPLRYDRPQIKKQDFYL